MRLPALPILPLPELLPGGIIDQLARLRVARVQVHHRGARLGSPDRRIDEDVLRQAGFSRTKAQTLKALSQHVDRGLLPLDAWADAPPPEEIRARLLAFRGVGPWTVSYVLLRGFGWLDGSLHGDVAVRRKLQALLACPEAVTEVAARRWLMEFSPWRALVAAHLWLMDTPSGG